MNARELTDQIAAKLAAEVRRNGDIIPYIAEDGVYKTDMRQKNLSWWTNGFWAGLLWQMYHAVGVAEFKATAEKTEGWLDEAMADFTGLHHDVGFMWMLSAVADYRLTGNEKSRIRAMHAATLLAGRYNPNGRFLRAWNGDKTGWMIVDCLMNLSLLYWASDETGDPRYAEIAQNHADTALRVLLRPDGSCNHIAVLDPVTGELTDAPAGQGYAPGSSWSRGQSWAVYGFALSAKHTGEARYLEAAKRSAHYFIANAATHNWEPLVDFLAPESPELLDMSAGAIAACGLLELEKQVSVYEKKLYHDAAEHLLSAIAKKHLDLAPETDGIVLDSTADYHKDIHTRMIYADYYFVEGLLRLQGKEFFRMVTGLDEFTKEHEYLICVDSDGCAMDTMNCKHLQCFGPCMVAEFGLDARRAEWLARWNEINLYSMTRGINRFKALALILEEADAGGTKIDGVQDLRSWTDTAPELSEKTAEAMYAKTGQPIFAKALAWSRAVNKAIAALPKTQVAAFPGAAQALAAAHGGADVAVVSSANREAVAEEWIRCGLADSVDVILCQDVGSKKACIEALMRKGFAEDRILMVGDAPGDLKAAFDNGVYFYPILVNHEKESWQTFVDTACPAFLSGCYGGEQATYSARFEENLKK